MNMLTQKENAHSGNVNANVARLHISTNKYFPNPANIKENIVKAQLVYQPVTELKQIKASMTDTDEVEKKIRAVWEDLGGCW